MIALIIAFFVTLMLGVPVAFCLGLAALAFLLFCGQESLLIVPTLMFSGVDSFPLMAIPFFIMAGDLAERSGILPSLVGLAKALVGHWRAGLAHVSIVTEMFLSGVTGTAVGDAAAIGSIFIPSMKREGYDARFAATLAAVASIMGPLIPPSVGMLIYSFVQGGTVSVAALFVAGAVPGVLVGAGLMIICTILARRRNYPVSSDKFSIRKVFECFRGALLGITAMAIILGGILTGIFTPTEAGAAATAYVLIVGAFFTRKLKFSSIIASLHMTAVVSSTVLILMATAKVCAWILTSSQVPQKIGGMLMAFSTSPIFFITLVVLLLTVFGFFIEGIAIMIMFVPVLAPAADFYGIEAHHFALVFVMAIQIAVITPPVCLSLFVTSKIAGIKLEDTFREVMPYWVFLVALTLMVAYWPGMTMWLPRMLGLLH
ncbi:MAG TPA: TRAP transporter large permease [Syntrophobacter fumaroxidans]|nr:TRAP transporter large permease [Syntrophobacter fumaroxidans]